MTHTAKEVADYIGAKLEGDANQRIVACASAELAGADDVIFVESEKHAEAAQKSADVGIVFVDTLPRAN